MKNYSCFHTGQARQTKFALCGKLLLFLWLGPGQVLGAEAIVNGAFDTESPVALRGFVGRQDITSAFPKLLGTSEAGVGWYSTRFDGHFTAWEPGFFGSPGTFGQHLELTSQGTVFQDFALTALGDATFSFLYTRGLSGSAQFSVSIGVPGMSGANDGSVLPATAFNPAGPFSDWQSFSANFLSLAPGTYRLSFTDITGEVNLDQPLIDQVSFTAVPEPTAAVLFAFAMVGGILVAVRRRPN